MKRIVIGFITVGLALLAAPATASTLSLAGNDEMYQVSCGGTNVNQLLKVDLSTESLTVIGTGEGPPGSGCAYQGALVSTTGWFYFIDIQADDRLLRANLETGDIEVLGTFHDGGSLPQMKSLAAGPDGEIYAISGRNLYSVDLTDASLTLVTTIDEAGLTDGGLYGFAYDPKTDKFYVADSGDGLFSLDITTGDVTLVGTNSDFWIGSMDFDSDGYLWFNGDGFGVARASLHNFGDTSKIRVSGDLSDTAYSESLQILRDPIPAKDKNNEGLAYTGAADISWVLGFGGIAGLGAVALRRRAK